MKRLLALGAIVAMFTACADLPRDADRTAAAPGAVKAAYLGYHGPLHPGYSHSGD